MDRNTQDRVLAHDRCFMLEGIMTSAPQGLTPH